MSQIENLHRDLLAEWAKPQNRDLKVVAAKLEAIKAELNDPAALSKLREPAALTIHKDYFEIQALYHVVAGNMKNFEEAIADVHSFYQCAAKDSVSKYLMYGLHLMFLLAENRLSEFHMLLEQIDQSVQQSDPYISLPVRLEQSLMEGAYNKVILNESLLPTPYYQNFVRVLMNTVRNDIASCIERSFKRLLIKDAVNMLLFEDPSSLKPFAEKNGWIIEKDVVNFESDKNKTDSQKPALDTKRIALQNIYYAKQLEMIV